MESVRPTPVQWLVLLALGLIIILGRVHTFHEPLGRDVATYAVAAHEMLCGRALYEEVWDHKPPAVHATFAVGELLAGRGRAAVFAVNVAAALLVLGGVAYAAAGLAGRVSAALWAGSIWAVLSLDPVLQANQPNVEVFMNACRIWAVALLLRALDRALPRGISFWGAGLILALGSLYKQTVVVEAALLSLTFVLISKEDSRGVLRRMRPLLAIGACGILSWLIVTGWFWARGSVGAFFDLVFEYNWRYAAAADRGLMTRLGQAGLACWDLLPPLLLLVSVLGVILGVRRSWRSAALLAAFGLCSLIVIALPGRSYYHYFQLALPFLALSAGCGPAWAGDTRYRAGRLAAVLGGVVVVAVLVLRVAPWFFLSPTEWSVKKYGPVFAVADDVGRRLGSHLEQEETLYEWGAEPGIYVASERRPASPIFSSYAFRFETPDGPTGRQLRRDLEQARPEVVVINTRERTAFPFPSWLNEEYRFAPRLSLRRYRSYVLRDGRLAAHRAELLESPRADE